MTKITVDKALIEQVIEAAFSPYCAQALGILVPALRAALAKPTVEPEKLDNTTQRKAMNVRNSIGLMKNEDAQNNYSNHAVAIEVLETYLSMAESVVEPVAAQHRFRHPQTTMPDWSPWQACPVSNRAASYVDSLGYEIEYRNLYAAPVTEPPPAEVPLLTDDEYTALAHRTASKYTHRSDPQHIAYTFLPHTLEQFARAIEQAVRQKAGLR